MWVTLGGLALLGVMVFARHYWTRAARPPELVYRRSPLIDHLLVNCPTLLERFQPTLWGFNRHLQLGLLAVRAARTAPLRFDRTDSLILADGGTVSLEWLGLDGPATDDESPTVVILPMICGDGQSLRRTVRAMRSRLSDLFHTVPDSILVLTARGGHCAFLEGHWRPRSWAHRLIAEYFRAVHLAPHRTPLVR